MKSSKFLWITGVLGTLCILGALYLSFYKVQAPTVSDIKVVSDSLEIKRHAEISIGQGTSSTTIMVDVADTEALQERGLGGRTTMTENQAMFFVFSIPEPYGFWMKDMFIPIDIIWLDKNLKVIYIKENVSPSTYPESFAPKTPALYVLEVASGFSSRHNVKIGDTIKVWYK
ncbi:MAG: DUF192 domain-containing protein [bacterium]